MENCIFCKIVKGEIPAKIVARTDFALAFEDITPQAPVHILVIPVEHIPSVDQTTDAELLGRLLIFASSIAKEKKLEKGFRFVINTGDEGGQTVHHLHLHILGGRNMHWPPG